MAKQLGFYFNSSACTGCKACQVACKDKNDLEVGLLWRRVYEVSGGDWEEREGVYRNSVFAYNISMACNHCEKPECVYKCPTNALQKDKKRGIVSIDPELCIGCRYCEWNCPYGAPQYDKNNGVMTKCDFCSDYLEQGKAPACVDACPMRALDFGEIGALRKKYGTTARVYPLVSPEETRPALVITPHPRADEATPQNAAVSNEEEV